jgi:hypothetical protein
MNIISDDNLKLFLELKAFIVDFEDAAYPKIGDVNNELLKFHKKIRKIEKKEAAEIEKKDTKPYLMEYTIDATSKYNPNFGDDKICKCGHTYYRHFDSYEHMEACGCKYCQCYNFRLKKQ